MILPEILSMMSQEVLVALEKISRTKLVTSLIRPEIPSMTSQEVLVMLGKISKTKLATSLILPEILSMMSQEMLVAQQKMSQIKEREISKEFVIQLMKLLEVSRKLFQRNSKEPRKQSMTLLKASRTKFLEPKTILLILLVTLEILKSILLMFLQEKFLNLVTK